ncbi:MAG: PD40 domain-containing protein [Candidatus Eremiobacteraeota bacterium]|nr:PD40 domain-containing protein [Candidatus Eremiobacteraeota bacterium]
MPFEHIAATLSGVHQFVQVALAPDGRRFAYVESVGDHSSIRLAEVAHAAVARAITACPGRRCEESDLAWSPDGRRIAFVTTDSKGQPQIAIAGVAASGAARILTRANGPLSTPRWSPDGARIAFLYSPDAPKAPSPLNPATPDAGVVGTVVYEQRLAVVPASGGAVRLLGPKDLNVYEFDWSPDGTRFAATAAHGNGDANWWIAELYTLDLAAGNATKIHHPQLQIASPRWSGDGKRIAYIGGIMSDEAITGGAAACAPSNGRPRRRSLRPAS